MNFGTSVIYFLGALLERLSISALHSLCCCCEMVLQYRAPGAACISPGRLVNVHGAMAAMGASRDEECSGSRSVRGGWPEDCSSQLCKEDDLALRSCCLNVLNFSFNCVVGHKDGIILNTSVGLKGWKLCLVHMVQLVLCYLMEPRGWPELVPTACLNGAAEFTSPCFILRK